MLLAVQRYGTAPVVGGDAAPVAAAAPAGPAILREIERDLAPAFAGGGDYAIVSAVREWVYARVDRAAGPDELVDWGGLPLDDVFARFAAGEGGVYCAGTAGVLADVYLALGYDAFVYNAELIDEAGGVASHAVVLVKIRDAGRTVWSVQDAYLDYSIEKAGAPADFVEMYRGLKAGAHEDYQPVSRRASCKPLLASDPAIRDYVASFYEVSDLEPAPLLSRFCHGFWLEEFVTRDPMGVGLVRYLEKIGHAPNVLYLFTYPSGITEEQIFALADG